MTTGVSAMWNTIPTIMPPLTMPFVDSHIPLERNIPPLALAVQHRSQRLRYQPGNR